MREVYAHPDFTRVGYFKSVLDQAGIPNFLQGDTSYNVTEISALFMAPSLRVVNDEDYDRAKKLLRDTALPPPSFRADWRCPSCGEEVPANFESCWQCGASPDEPPPL